MYSFDFCSFSWCMFSTQSNSGNVWWKLWCYSFPIALFYSCTQKPEFSLEGVFKNACKLPSYSAQKFLSILCQPLGCVWIVPACTIMCLWGTACTYTVWGIYIFLPQLYWILLLCSTFIYFFAHNITFDLFLSTLYYHHKLGLSSSTAFSHKAVGTWSKISSAVLYTFR